ncbi:MAG: carboxypeptidase regulatory-like domain-containing protein [Chloracidobacterium sp.]|nr:carboxypeptidase regulatory-like domain-containing protein [Chloracidobacterium sp.]
MHNIRTRFVTALFTLSVVCLTAAATFGQNDKDLRDQDGKKIDKDIFEEKVLPGRKAEPVIVGKTTWSEIVARDLVAPKPNFEEILRSKGKRPRNPPAEEMESAPDSIIKRNPGSYFDYSRVIQERPSAPLVASPSPSLDFQGLGDANFSIPPDTHGAVGPNHIMTALNTQVRIQSKTGGTLSTVTLNSFFATVGGGGGTFDPRVLYDPYANRWICVAVDDAQNATSKVLIAVSQTNDPTGTWNFYGYDHDAADIEWADYPMVGFNKNWIAVSINDFAISNNAGLGANTYIFDKSTLYAGAPTPTMAKVPIDGATFGNVHQPVETYDNTTETLYVIQRWSSSAGQLRIYTITGTSAAPAFTATALFPSSTGWSTTAVAAPQSGGGAITVTNNDSRMQRVVLRNGSVWAAHTIFLTGPSRTSVQWWQFNPASGAVDQMGRIDDPTGTNFYAFPSIAVNANNHALIGYSAFSATTFPSAAYSYRAAADGITTTRDPLRYKNGLACYRKTFGGTTNRWGDYSNTVVDPTDDTTFWTLQEYAETSVGGDCTVNNTGRYGVWWAKVNQLSTSVTISGRVLTAQGRGVRNAIVRLTLPDTSIRTVVSGPLGQFSFANVASGQTYGLTATGRRFTFGTQNVSPTSGDVTGLTIVAQ